MTKALAIASAAVLMALSSASVASAQSSPLDPCMVEARAYCFALYSDDRLAFYNCVQEEYAACIGSATAKPVDGDKVYIRRCKA